MPICMSKFYPTAYISWKSDSCERTLNQSANGGDYLAFAASAFIVQWNLFITTTFMIKFITCDLFRNMF